MYNFPKIGNELASKTNKYMEDKFSKLVKTKDGFMMINRENIHKHRVLEFVVPIVYPKKPNRITVTLANTIFGALSREQLVNWRLVIKDVVGKLASGEENYRPSSICFFLLHLY